MELEYGKIKTMGSHFQVNASPATFMFTIPAVPPPWWDRLRKHPVVDWIIKPMVRELVKELLQRGWEWVVWAVQQLFQQVRTSSGAHGKSHAA